MLCKSLKQMARQRRKSPFRCLTANHRGRRHIVRMSFLVQSTDMTDYLGLHTANHSAAKMAFIIGGNYFLVIIEGSMSQWPRGLRWGLRPLAFWDFGFECRRVMDVRLFRVLCLVW
jgi:hypothetical protein